MHAGTETSGREDAQCDRALRTGAGQIVFINTAWPEERTRIRKTNAEMAGEGLDKSSTDVWKKTMIERYEDHAPESEAITLAEFATDYQATSHFNENQYEETITFL